jgi:hypothetical protein
MRGRKPSFTIHLSAAHRQQLQHWQRSTNLKQGLTRRGRLLLLPHQGYTLKAAAQTAGLTVRNARKGAKRYLTLGLSGLADQPGRGRKPVFSPLGGPASGPDRLRTTGSTRPLLVPVGLPPTG